jgi:transcriptional regulator with XRE-family HTH domain
MTDTHVQNGTTRTFAPVRVGEARRSSGLTRKELADRLGVSLLKVERLESGEADLKSYVPAISRVTGHPAAWFESRAPVQPPPETTDDVGPATGAETTREDRFAVAVVLLSLIGLVVVRFFTETVPVLPRAFNVIDIPILFVLVFLAMWRRRAPGARSATQRWVMGVALGLVLLMVVATLTNPTRVDVGPALVFAYGVLSPIVAFGAVRRLWPAGHAMAASRVLVGLGVLQLVIGLHDVPAAIAAHTADALSGTFGTNAYQLVFFLLVFVSLVAGIYVNEPRRLTARIAPFLIAAALVMSVLAQYRALLPTMASSLLLAAVILVPFSGRRGLIAGLMGMAALIVTLAVAAQQLPYLKLAPTFAENPVTLASDRLKVTDQLTKLYSDTPRFMITGTGPGTYSSRGWQAFATSQSTSRANVVGPYALALTGGTEYHTDVSDKYVLPLLRDQPVVAGSTAVSSPYSSYISVSAELGLLGGVLFAALYIGAFVAALRRTLRVGRSAAPGDPLPALLLATTIAFFALIQMGVLQDWLEVTRITFLAWIMFAITTKELDARDMDGAVDA